MIAFSSKNLLYVTVLSGFIKRGPQLSAKSTNGSMTLKSLGTTGLWATYSLKAICPNFLLAGVSWKLKSFGTFSHHTPSPFSPQHIPPPSSPQHTPLPSSPQHIPSPSSHSTQSKFWCKRTTRMSTTWRANELFMLDHTYWHLSLSRAAQERPAETRRFVLQVSQRYPTCFHV